jgi:translation initiation factor 1 (eIF-1/SUI1)
MALTKETEYQYEIVTNYKHIQILEMTIIKEDDVELSRSNHRKSITCIEDISNESQEVKDLANLLWTDEIKTAYSSSMAAQ